MALRREERFGLWAALALHVALAALLLVQPDRDEAFAIPERMTVNLADEVGLEAASPEPVPESRAAVAPEIADLPAPPTEPELRELPPEPVRQPVAQPRPRPSPAPRTEAQPRPRETAAPAPRQTSAPERRSGGSRIGSDFLPGAGSSTTTEESRVPASQIGASARASLVQAMARQLKPHWQPPSGPEVENIVTVLSFRLNPDGSLAGRPTVRRQTGVTDLNRHQAQRHAEQAVRAVQLAAPFDLPSEYYEAWKNVSAFSFDWKLSQ